MSTTFNKTCGVSIAALALGLSFFEFVMAQPSAPLWRAAAFSAAAAVQGGGGFMAAAAGGMAAAVRVAWRRGGWNGGYGGYGGWGGGYGQV